MKICTKCKVNKELIEYDKKGDGLSSHCKSCRIIMVKNHYNKNKQYYIDKAAKRRSIEYKKYTDYKESLSCEDCGISFQGQSYLCDFHHKEDKEKLVNPSSYSGSIKKLKEEVEKCVALCANCHRHRHYKGD